jgi:hypothetical protein
MGRGRAKAKQVKVARQLKYSGGGTDLDRLRAELGVDNASRDSEDSDYADLSDRYSADDDSEDDDSDDEDWESDDVDDYDAEDLTSTSA